MVIADAVRIVDTLTIHNRLPPVQEWKMATGSSVPSKRPRDDQPPPDRKAKKSTISKQGNNDKELQRLARQFGRCFDCGLHPEGSLETHKKECVKNPGAFRMRMGKMRFLVNAGRAAEVNKYAKSLELQQLGAINRK
jgi:hypothetical protein